MARRSAPSSAAAARHRQPYVKSMGSGHGCTISWDRLGVPPPLGGGERTGGIDLGGRRTSGANRNEKSGLRSAVRRDTSVSQGARGGPKLRRPSCRSAAGSQSA